jgi:hypothetical protein
MKSHDLARKLLSMENHHVRFDWDGGARGGMNDAWTAPRESIDVTMVGDDTLIESIIVIDAE